VLAAAHRDEYPLTPDECAAIAESAETWCRRWSRWQSDSIADVAHLVAARLCGSAPTFVRRGRTVLRRHGQLWALHVQQGPWLTLREPVVEGQHYLVVNCDDHPLVRRIWVMWNAQRGDFETVREAGSPLRRFAFVHYSSNESHVEDVLPKATYRLARVPVVPVSVAAVMIAARTCPACGRQAGVVAAVERERAITAVACRVCGHRWKSARAGGVASGA